MLFFILASDSLISKEELLTKPSNDIGQASAFATEPTNSRSRSVGFSTALGRRVNVSSDALKKAKMIFEDVDVKKLADKPSQPDTKGESMKITGFGSHSSLTAGFSTASGHRVNVSSDALKKAKMIFEDDDVQQLEKLPSTKKLHQKKPIPAFNTKGMTYLSKKKPNSFFGQFID